MEYLKPFLEALNLKPKTRLTGFIFGLALLLLKPLLLNYNMGWFYKHLSWLAVTITLLFGATLISDLCELLKDKINSSKAEKNYSNHILNLSGERLEIVKKLYNNPHHQGYLRQNDTNVIELYNKFVIVQLSNRVIVRENQVADINDPGFLFVIQPLALRIIEKHPSKFEK